MSGVTADSAGTEPPGPAPPPARAGPAGGRPGSDTGTWWAAHALVLVAFVAAALAPLHEMDLGQHLANGEWIWRHQAVPFTEPFAWTRAGQPFYAYSWLPELVYYALLRAFGPLGLHLLEGLIAAGAVAALLWAGGRLGWPRPVRLGLAVLHLAAFWGVSAALRPQQLLFITVPLAWGVTAGLSRAGPGAARLLALAAVGALAANTHIFFPLTAVPVGYWLIADRHERRWLLAGAALLAGWLVSPYGLVWPRVFALNFGHNIMLGQPPSIRELMPGLDYAVHRPGAVIAGAALLLAPWVGAPGERPRRARVADALAWTAGLLLFAFAGRMVAAWWLVSLPLAGAAAARVLQATSARLRPRLASSAALILGVLLLAAAAPPVRPRFWRFEGGTMPRMLPRAAEDPALWLPSWLLCNTRPGAHGRVFTEFNYGSELNWRLPGYSPSIDGRTIFPDSIAVDFSVQPAGRYRRHAETWRSAELALLDRSFWLAPVLDLAPDWVLLAHARRGPRGGSGALWAKRQWWQRWGTAGALPALDVQVGDPRATCAASGKFPS